MKLKTLKEMEGFYPSIIHGQAFAQSDKNEEGTTGNFILRNRLKQEAIKWVKYFRMVRSKAQQHAFMNFFNITEEDLK